MDDAGDQVAMLVHDLRQPLSLVALHAQQLAQDAAADTRDAGRSIQRACRQMGRLIETMLALYRPDMEQRTIERRPRFLEVLLHDVASDVRPLARECRVELAVEVSGATPVEIDEAGITRVLRNLIDNALKYTPAGGSVTLACRRISAQRIEVSVVDPGPGLRDGEAPLVFERWRRDLSRGGSGLGLAIAKEIVEAHGGAITYRRQSGGGTCFSFTLPTLTAIDGAPWTDADGTAETPSWGMGIRS